MEEKEKDLDWETQLHIENGEFPTPPTKTNPTESVAWWTYPYPGKKLPPLNVPPTPLTHHYRTVPVNFKTIENFIPTTTIFARH